MIRKPPAAGAVVKFLEKPRRLLYYDYKKAGVKNLTITQEIDRKHEEDLQRLRNFRLLEKMHFRNRRDI